MKKKLPFLQQRLRRLALSRSMPEFSAVLGFGANDADDYYLSLPFKRSLPVILVSAAFLAIFSFPLFTMGELFGSIGDESLFSLISVLFSLFWMLGWSAGVMVLLLVFLCLSLGKESLHVTQGKLTLNIGIPGVALSGSYDANLIRNFRYQEGDIAAGKKWRGNHLAFGYGDADVAFGSDIDSLEASKIISRLNGMFPLHDSPPVELGADVISPGAAEAEVSTSAQLRNTIRESAIPVRWNSLSGITLILANLIPLLGVWFAGWEIGQIMFLFWAESAIIGYYNLCKMWKVGRWSLLLYGPFFVGHYGVFMAVHLLFIYALFGGEMAGNADTSRTQVFADMQALWPALLGLLISHGISYYTNFVKKNKSEGRSMAQQMQEPYKRIIIMHMTLIFGGFLTLSLGSGVSALMLLLVLKIAADLRGHVSQHS